MKPRTYDIQISTIMSILDPKIDPVVLLTKSSSLAKRRRAFGSTVKDHKSLMQDLHTWFCAEGSSLFVLRAGPRAETEAKGIAVDVVNLLRPTPYRVLWNLSPTSMSDSAISTTAVLKGLVHQALQKDTDFLLHNPEQLNFVKFQSDHTEEEWLHLLSLLFARLPKSFLVVETQDLFHINREIREWVKRCLELFQTLVDRTKGAGSAVKVLLVSYDSVLPVTAKGDRIVSTVQRATPVPPHLRRRFVNAKRGRSPLQSMKPRF